MGGIKRWHWSWSRKQKVSKADSGERGCSDMRKGGFHTAGTANAKVQTWEHFSGRARKPVGPRESEWEGQRGVNEVMGAFRTHTKTLAFSEWDSRILSRRASQFCGLQQTTALLWASFAFCMKWGWIPLNKHHNNHCRQNPPTNAKISRWILVEKQDTHKALTYHRQDIYKLQRKN